MSSSSFPAATRAIAWRPSESTLDLIVPASLLANTSLEKIYIYTYIQSPSAYLYIHLKPLSYISICNTYYIYVHVYSTTRLSGTRANSLLDDALDIKRLLLARRWLGIHEYYVLLRRLATRTQIAASRALAISRISIKLLAPLKFGR